MLLGEDLRGVIVSLPKAPMDDYVGVVEVLIQTGLPTFTAPTSADGFADLVGIFGARARFGATGIVTAEEVTQARDAGASFVLADVADEAIARAAQERGLACFLPAMTPTEVRAVLASSEDVGVALYPADVVGHAMAARLAALSLIDRLVPTGGLGAYAAGEWLKAGAQAVCVDSTLLGDALSGGSLSKLRDRSGAFVTAHRRAVGGPVDD